MFRAKLIVPVICVTLALLPLMACGKDATAPIPTVAGTWSGTVNTQVVTMTLVDNAGTVTGNGTITNTPTGTRALTVAGSFANGKSLSVTLTSGTVQPINYSATLHATGASLTGPLNGSGFSGEILTIVRQP